MRSKVVWVDDDRAEMMRPLGRSLNRRGLQVIEFGNYAEAVEYLEEQAKLGELEEQAVLVDVILPRSDNGETLNPYLGFELAGLAAEKGVKAICFLSVLGREEVIVQYKDIRRKFQGVDFRFVDKLTLLDVGVMARMTDFLKKGSEE